MLNDKHIKEEQRIISSSSSNEAQIPIVGHLIHYRNMFASPEFFIRRQVDYSKLRVFKENYRKESERVETFKDFPSNLTHLIIDLSRAGFYCIENSFFPDQVKCIYCQGTFENWSKNDIPIKKHKHTYPTCPFVISLNVGNEPKVNFPIKSPDIDIGITNSKASSNEVVICTLVFNKVKPLAICDRIDHLDVFWREDTFKDYESLKHFSRSGLFVIKVESEQYIECCWCRKSTEILDGVEGIKEIWFHRNYCEKNRLRYYNDDCNDGSNSENGCDVEYAVTPEEIEARVETNLVYQNALKDFAKSSNENIKSVVERRLKGMGKDFESLYEFLKAIKHDRKPVVTISNVNKTNVTLAEFICAVCFDNVVGVIFLPCGHLKTCEKCAVAVTTCPVCRKLIERRVRNMRFYDKK